MFVYSGEVKMCETGLKTSVSDDCERELHTGDIVVIYTTVDVDGGYIDGFHGLSCVVCDQFGKACGEPSRTTFVMGIADAFINKDPKWNYRIVKKFDQVVDGEHWKEYKFSFRSE